MPIGSAMATLVSIAAMKGFADGLVLANFPTIHHRMRAHLEEAAELTISFVD